MAMEQSYTTCDNGCGNIITVQYERRYGQCEYCHLPVGVKISNAFRYSYR